MFVAVDVGNTQTTLALYDGKGKHVHGWRLKTDRTDTSDELLSKLCSFFAISGYEVGSIDAAGIACVVPTIARAWRKVFKHLIGKEPLVISAAETYGIPIEMPYPQTIGADRICNAIAAKKTYGAPVIVVDFGTATNIDVVNAEGAFCGGAIAPGLMLSAAALFERAAKLSSIPIEAPKHALGRDTAGALQSGLVVGAAAMAEGLVARIKDELSIEDAPVVATGGLARTVGQATNLFTAIDSDLTLRGVYLIWCLTQGRRPTDSLDVF